MNCQEVIDILDDQRVEQLDPALRAQVGAHLALCPECARAWHLHEGLAALPGIAMPADFTASCRQQVAAGPGAARSTRPRVLIVGTLVALAAAATLITLLRQPSAPATSHVAQLPVAAVAPAAPLVEAPQLQPQPQLRQEEEIRVESPRSPTAPVAAAGIVVQLLPLQVPASLPVDVATLSEASRASFLTRQAQDNDPSRKQALQSLHANVREQLLAIPGLRLVDGDPAEVAPASRGYRVRVNSVMTIDVSGQIARDDARLMVSMEAERSPSPQERTAPWRALQAITLQADCSGAVSAGAPKCFDAPTVAAEMVRKLRQEFLPPDAALVQTLQAAFGDASRDPAQRANDLLEILKLQARSGDNSMLRDAAVVRAAIQLAAAGTPDIRAQVWRGMRGSGAVALIEPMVTSLQQDPDDVRLAAIETLGADFPADPQARAALQAAAAQDARPLLRAVAQRGLAGEESWRQYMLSSLANTELPPASRLEALMYALYPTTSYVGFGLSNPRYQQILTGLDEDAVRSVAATLPAAGTLRYGNNFLGNFAVTFRQHPEVTTMLLRILQDHPAAVYRMVAAQTLFGSRNSDPRVKEALAKALESDADQQVRDLARRLQ